MLDLAIPTIIHVNSSYRTKTYEFKRDKELIIVGEKDSTEKGFIDLKYEVATLSAVDVLLKYGVKPEIAKKLQNFVHKTFEEDEVYLEIKALKRLILT